MAAFVVVEMEVIDPEAKDRYSKAAAPLVKEFGGEFIAAGAWTLLTGQVGLKNGAIIRFENRAQAMAWYESPSYQSIINDRNQGMNCRFQLLG